MAIDKIAERLKAEGYKNKYKSWDITNGSTVAKILCNDIYWGVTRFGDVITENTHEPLVTREQFEKVRKIKKKRQEIYGSLNKEPCKCQ
ncbi:MAG: recombinase family protein [Oscillospiraceae bacterium]|nr:recombinase family protein [Oscillospiraceae bacterium]